MIDGIQLANITIDCGNAEGLSAFYHKLLGWERCEMFGHPAVKRPDGLMLLFVQEDDYVPPVWPEEPGKQQKQIHLDLLVPDVAGAVAYAESIGAVKAPAQFGGDAFVTVFDPEGHPICLCQNS